MTNQSRYKGILTLDAMMSIIPTMLILVFLMQSMSLAANSQEERSGRADVFDRLVSVADYSVKSGLAKHDGDVRYPNWVDRAIDNDYIEGLREKSGFAKLEISFTEPEMGTCVYRLVVVGDEKRLSKIYFCGE